LDLDGTGMINASELEDAVMKMGYKMTGSEIKKIITSIDYAGNGKINYSEFLAATISIKSVLNNEMLWGLFKHFDTDNTNIITPNNI
jgi:calcium-dependent protein kinase